VRVFSCESFQTGRVSTGLSLLVVLQTLLVEFPIGDGGREFMSRTLANMPQLCKGWFHSAFWVVWPGVLLLIHGLPGHRGRSLKAFPSV
jgi:hypothetical protein